MQAHKYWSESNWNATDSVYTFETGSKMEFFSTDNGDKLRGARRDRLFMNEANNITLDAFDQLEVRTKEFVYLDWNPTNEFWFYTDIQFKRNDVELIILTYIDNEALSPEIVDSIEQRKNRAWWWKVYGEGQLGEVEGKIYKDWQIVDEVPHEAKLVRYGMDFGYTNDPSAIVAIYEYNGGYILDEIIYRKWQSNKQLADHILNEEEQVMTVADSSEPKSIDEISSYGVDIIWAKKQAEKTWPHKTYNVWAISKVQEQRISVTKQSINVIKEYRNYLWMTDKVGKILNEPEWWLDHALDAIKYGMISLIWNSNTDFDIDSFTEMELNSDNAVYNDIGL